MDKALEVHEHAHHAAHQGSKSAALLIAVLAAILAVCEQLMSQDLSAMLASLDPPEDATFAQKREALSKRLSDDAARFQKDPNDGKDAIAVRARQFEMTREEALERAHTFDNAAAALELGIVLATASAITASTMLIRLSMMLGVAGVALAILGATYPSLGAF
jgi:hypothetical protein